MNKANIYLAYDGNTPILMLPLSDDSGFINEISATKFKLGLTGLSPDALDLIRDQLLIG